jgi:lipopolysaccharide transport system permease protein
MFKVSYKQTILGAAWAVLQPVFTMIVLTIFFGRLAKVRSNGLPYPIFSFCALLPWRLFARALNDDEPGFVFSQEYGAFLPEISWECDPHTKLI